MGIVDRRVLKTSKHFLKLSETMFSRLLILLDHSELHRFKVLKIPHEKQICVLSAPNIQSMFLHSLNMGFKMLKPTLTKMPISSRRNMF